MAAIVLCAVQTAVDTWQVDRPRRRCGRIAAPLTREWHTTVATPTVDNRGVPLAVTDPPGP